MTMASLYVDRKGVSLELDGGALRCYEAGALTATLPLAPIERVFLRGDVRLSASLLGALGKRDIGVVVLSGRRAEPTLLLHRPHNDARRRLAQYRMADDADRRLGLARRFVDARLASQVTLLQEAAEQKPLSRYPLTVAARRIVEVRGSLPDAASLPALRGREGAAAAAFFAGFQELFAPSLGFSARNRRPPRDPVNAVLSLGYTLVHAEAVLAAYGAGLDPFVGALHDLDYGRESLACDLAEPVRIEVERFAVAAFRSGTLRTEDFSSDADGACLLGKAGRQRFYAAWDERSEVVRGQLANWVRTVLAALDSDSEHDGCPG